MKKYAVYVPVAGYVYREIEAESKQEAIDKVFEEGYEDEDIVELELHEDIVTGNVCHVNTPHAYAEEIDE